MVVGLVERADRFELVDRWCPLPARLYGSGGQPRPRVARASCASIARVLANMLAPMLATALAKERFLYKVLRHHRASMRAVACDSIGASARYVDDL